MTLLIIIIMVTLVNCNVNYPNIDDDSAKTNDNIDYYDDIKAVHDNEDGNDNNNINKSHNNYKAS